MFDYNSSCLLITVGVPRPSVYCPEDPHTGTADGLPNWAGFPHMPSCGKFAKTGVYTLVSIWSLNDCPRGMLPWNIDKEVE